MLLAPLKPKYYKSFSSQNLAKMKGYKIHKLKFSKLSLISLEKGFIPTFQIEATRLVLKRLLKKRSQLFYRLFTNHAITKKPNEVRLGRGKGRFKY